MQRRGGEKLTLSEFLNRGREITALVGTADAAELKQLSEEWRLYRPAFFALAREAEARACVDLLNYFEAVDSAISLRLIREWKGQRL